MTPSAARRLRTLLAAALAAASTIAPLALGTPAAHAASSFTLFDNTSYNNANLQADYGLTPSGVVYDSWDITCADVDTYSCTLPDEADYQAKIKAADAAIPATSPLTLDFENIDITSGTPVEEADNDCQTWETLVSWTRAVIPANQPLGNYSYDWDQSGEGLSCNTTLHTETDGFTFFAPSLYTYTDDLTGSDWTSWTDRVTESITNDNAIAPGQPIYPYIWPQWDDSSADDYSFMDATSWLEELDYLQSETQGAIVWSGGAELGSSSCGWIGSTHNFMTSLLGSGGSTGSLNADVQFPNTCMLTRDETNAIPVTITNDGSTTSAATTLSVTAGTGITGTPTDTSVPALAAGATWSTTVDMAIGLNATLGDTVIGFDLAGEGVQNRTAIIEDPDLALNEPATQSSTDGSYTASFADNGDTTATNYSETDSAAQARWQVDLGSSQNIGGVDLYAGTVDPDNYYLIISNTSTPALQTSPLPPNQWIETSSGTWVMNVYASSFRYPQWREDTSPRGMADSTDIPAGLNGQYVTVQLADTGQLSLTQVEVTPGSPDGPNLLSTDAVANGGFETGSLAPWTASGTVGVATSPEVSGSETAQVSADSFLSQTINVKPNTTYTLSGFIEPENSGNAVELGVENYGGAYTTYYTSNDGWTDATVTFTTGSTNTTAEIFVYNDLGSGVDYADAITCYPTS